MNTIHKIFWLVGWAIGFIAATMVVYISYVSAKEFWFFWIPALVVFYAVWAYILDKIFKE